MMNRDILESAERAQPELMKKTAMAVGLIEKMAPEFLEDVLQEFEAISEVTLEKVASMPDSIRKGAIGVAAIVGTGVAASLGSAIATDLFDAAKRGLTKGRNFRRIMEQNPNLRNEIHDKSRLKPAYDAIHRYAPDFTADPLIGGSLLKSLANQPSGNEYQLITNLLGSRKNLADVKNNQFRTDWKTAKELVTGRGKGRNPGSQEMNG
jgi:hypothetical protein